MDGSTNYVALVESILEGFEQLGSNRRMADDDVLNEVHQVTYVLQDAVPILRKFTADEPPPRGVSDAIFQIQDDLHKLQAALKLFLQISRTQALKDACAALVNHKLILNAELARTNTRATRGTVAKAKKKVFEVAADAESNGNASEPALEKALRVLAAYEGSLQNASFADGSEKLTVELLKALASHWGVLLPKKLKKKQAVVDYMHKARSKPAKKPLGDVSNAAAVITVAF